MIISQVSTTSVYDAIPFTSWYALSDAVMTLAEGSYEPSTAILPSEQSRTQASALDAFLGEEFFDSPQVVAKRALADAKHELVTRRGLFWKRDFEYDAMAVPHLFKSGIRINRHPSGLFAKLLARTYRPDTFSLEINAVSPIGAPTREEKLAKYLGIERGFLYGALNVDIVPENCNHFVFELAPILSTVEEVLGRFDFDARAVASAIMACDRQRDRDWSSRIQLARIGDLNVTMYLSGVGHRFGPYEDPSDSYPDAWSIGANTLYAPLFVSEDEVILPRLELTFQYGNKRPPLSRVRSIPRWGKPVFDPAKARAANSLVESLKARFEQNFERGEFDSRDLSWMEPPSFVRIGE